MLYNPSTHSLKDTMLGTNRDNIATAMTAILFLAGVGVLAIGISAYKDETFVLYLNNLVDSISGGNIQLDEFETELPNEVRFSRL